MTTCGYCGGSGSVGVNPYDGEGRYRGPGRRGCEYCGGSGVCDDGDRLLSARKYHDDGGSGQPPPGTPAWG